MVDVMGPDTPRLALSDNTAIEVATNCPSLAEVTLYSLAHAALVECAECGQTRESLLVGVIDTYAVCPRCVGRRLVGAS